MLKFKLLDKDQETGLHRIQALRDIPAAGVTKGDLGGWVAKEKNLSQKRDAWVFENAGVFGNARVSGNAQVFGNARVFGNAWVYENARVYAEARVYGDAWVSGNAQVFGDARVFGDAWVFGDAQVIKCLSIQQLRHNITCTYNWVSIGCQGHTWEYWAENIEEICKKHGYTDAEIESIAHILCEFYLVFQGESNE